MLTRLNSQQLESNMQELIDLEDERELRASTASIEYFLGGWLVVIEGWDEQRYGLGVGGSLLPSHGNTFARLRSENASLRWFSSYEIAKDGEYLFIERLGVYTGEVFKALNKTRGLYLRWQEVSACPVSPSSPEVEWTSTELRNALRSIEWDLEDLEDTICIVERNSSKFKIDKKEICDRRTFIEATKQEVKVMKSRMSVSRVADADSTAREPLLADESPMHFTNSWKSTPKYSKYSKLASQTDSPRHELLSMQDRMLGAQSDQLQVIAESVGSLKTVSKQIGVELDEQAVMLDDLNTELENADSKLDSTIKKVAKVLHMNNDRRQWLAIALLLGLLVIILILFIII